MRVKRGGPQSDWSTSDRAAVVGVTLAHPAPGVFAGRIEGHYTEAMLLPYLAGMEVALGSTFEQALSRARGGLLDER